MSDSSEKRKLPKLLEVPIVSLDPSSLKARIWEKTGLDIGEGDPIHAAQVIYVAAMEDQARLLDLQAERMDKVFSDHLEIFHTETEAIIKSMKDEINAQTIQERMAVMSEQINRADLLAKSIKSNSRLFKLFTVVNVLSLCAAVTILFFVLN
jgi:hypothetical protein